MQQLRRDPEFLFFAAMVGLALAISAPFTYGIAAPFHQAGAQGSAAWWAGGVLTIALVILLEAGAVGSRVAGVVWLSRALLLLTFVANYVTGSSYWARADLSAMPALLTWRLSWLGWVAPVLYAASVPVLLDVFMGHALTRARGVLSGAPRTVVGEVAELRRDVRSVAAALVELAEGQRRLLVAPEQVSYPRPEHVADVAAEMPQTGDPWACSACGVVATTGQRGAATTHGYWRCKGCGARQYRQKRH